MVSAARLRGAAGAVLLAACLVLSGCSLLSPASPTSSPGVATNPPGTPISGTLTPSGAGSPGSSPSASAQAGGSRTVLATLGLRMHASPAVSAKTVGTLEWGDTVTVIAYTASGGAWPGSTVPGAWYQVQAATITGWIVADPAYSAAGSLSSGGFSDKDIDGVLYPSNWTYADDPGEIVFQPQTGSDRPTLVIRVAAKLAALGSAGVSGYTSVSSNGFAVVCGYTGTEVQFEAPSGATPEAATDAGGGKVTRLADFVQFRATLSSNVAIDIEMNYSTAAEYSVFQNVLTSIRYPFPLCEAAPSSTSTPA